MGLSLQNTKQRHIATSNYPLSRSLARRLMLYFNAFRLVIALVILFVLFFGSYQSTASELFNIAKSTAIVYLVDSILMIVLLNRNPEQPHILAQFAFITDVLITGVLIYTLDSLANGTGLLLIFWCSAAALVLSRKFAIILASASALFVLGFTGWYVLYGDGDANRWLVAGIYATTFMLGALTFSALARWNQQYELLARQHRVDLGNLEQVNEIIIRRMRAGVLVIDANDEVRLMNESAWFLLGSPNTTDHKITEIAPELMKLLRAWRSGRDVPDEPVALTLGHSPVIPSFITIPGTKIQATLVFLQDTAKLSRQASTIATDTLAKLSGSIAHEIRNPLAAIVNAGELLQESTTLSEGNRRLLDIISNQSERINNIIENIFQLSRQQRSRAEVLLLNSELQTLVTEYKKMMPDSGLNIRLELPMTPVYGLFDRSQFQQVIHQLLENATTHAKTAEAMIDVIIGLNVQLGTGKPIVDVQDNGVGIDEAIIADIFEPFYSTHKQGSGLGLYITQQLCAINQTEISAISQHQSGALFRMILPAAARNRDEQDVTGASLSRVG